MPDNSRIQYRLSNDEGKEVWFDANDFDKDFDAISKAYGDRKIRMVDTSNNDVYDINISDYKSALGDGFRPYRMRRTTVQPKKEEAPQVNAPVNVSQPVDDKVQSNKVDTTPRQPVQQVKPVQPANTAGRFQLPEGNRAEVLARHDVLNQTAPVDNAVPEVAQARNDAQQEQAARKATANRYISRMENAAGKKLSAQQRKAVEDKISTKGMMNEGYAFVPGLDTKQTREQAEGEFEDFYKKYVAGVFESEQEKASQQADSAKMKYTGTDEGDSYAASYNEVVDEKYNDPVKIASAALGNMDAGAMSKYVMRRLGVDTSKTGGAGSAMSKEDAAMFDIAFTEMYSHVADQLQQRMYDDYAKKQAPKSSLDYIMGSAFHDNLVMTIKKAVNRMAAGSSGLREQLRQKAYADYGEKAGAVTRGVASAATLIADAPAFGISGTVASQAEKQVIKQVAKNIVKNGTNVAMKDAVAVAGRMLQQNNAMRLLSTSAKQGINFGTFNVMSGTAQQAKAGEYNIGEIAKSGAEGLFTGALLGAVGTKVGHIAGDATKMQKVAAGINGFGAEVGVFTGLDVLKNGDSYTDKNGINWCAVGGKAMENLTMVGLMKLQGINGIRQRMKMSGKYDMTITDNDWNALRNAGYDVDNMFSFMGKMQSRGGGEVEADGVEMADSQLDNLNSMLNDNRIPQKVRAKFRYTFQGVMTVLPVYGVGIDGNKVTTYGVDSEIESKEFKTAGEAKEYAEGMKDEVTLNNIDLLQKAAGVVEKQNGVAEGTIEGKAWMKVSEETGIDVNDVLAKKANERTPEEKAALEMYSNELRKEAEAINGEDSEAEQQENVFQKAIESGDKKTAQDVRVETTEARDKFVEATGKQPEEVEDATLLPEDARQALDTYNEGKKEIEEAVASATQVDDATRQSIMSDADALERKNRQGKTGEIVTAVHEGQKYYVVSGDIDNKMSSVVIWNQESGKRFVLAGSLESVDVQSKEDYIASRERALVEDGRAKVEATSFDSFEPGSQVFVDENGTQGTVLSNDGNTVLYQVGEDSYIVPVGELQTLQDKVRSQANAQKAEVDAAREQKAAEIEAQAQQQLTEAGVVPGNKVTLYDEAYDAMDNVTVKGYDGGNVILDMEGVEDSMPLADFVAQKQAAEARIAEMQRAEAEKQAAEQAAVEEAERKKLAQLAEQQKKAEAEKKAREDAERGYPVDADGNPDYKMMQSKREKEQYVTALRTEFGEDAVSVVDEQIKEWEKQITHFDTLHDPIQKARKKKVAEAEISFLESVKNELESEAKDKEARGRNFDNSAERDDYEEAFLENVPEGEPEPMMEEENEAVSAENVEIPETDKEKENVVEQKEETAEPEQAPEASVTTGEGYTVEPAQYTTKRGKVLDMQLVKFDSLTPEQEKEAKKKARELKGWYDREQGGFMMRDEDSVKKLADSVNSVNADTPEETVAEPSEAKAVPAKEKPEAVTEPKETAEKPKAQPKPAAKKAEAKKQEGKIDDWGEKIWGARKDMLRTIAEKIDNITAQSLIQNPLAKVFKKPDFKKLVDSGALREKDAKVCEAIISALVPMSKPKAGTKEDRYERRLYGKGKVEVWAEGAVKGIEALSRYMKATEEERDAMIDELIKQDEEVFEKEIAAVKRMRELNPGMTIEEKHAPNPVKFALDLLDAIGYRAGDKISPLPRVRVSGTHMYLENEKGKNIAYPHNAEEALEQAKFSAMVRDAMPGLSIPVNKITYGSTNRTKSEEPTKWEVYRYRSLKSSNPTSIDEFKSKAEADEYAKKLNDSGWIAYVHGRHSYTPTDYKFVFYDPNKKEYIVAEDAKLTFKTREEADAYLSENYDEVNEALVNANAKDKNREVGKREPLHIAITYGKGGAKYSIVCDDPIVKRIDVLGQDEVVLMDFNTRKEAEEYLAAHKEELFAPFAKAKEDARNFVYFEPNKPRIGEDYRKGRNVTEGEFGQEFGFRGVQFGNWTNEKDRQMSINEAYDAFKDLAKALGLSDKAISLNGELGIAFGARGHGKANAHYEIDNVVINLTKTRGAGSLAHEWLHAIDNYFSRVAGDAIGMVTSTRTTQGMRPELRDAFNELMRATRNTQYFTRSMKKGASYWGTDWEVAARLFAEWINDKLNAQGENNSFLSRGIEPVTYDRVRENNYWTYKNINKDEDVELMSYEEFAKIPESLGDFPYPTKEETAELAPYIEKVFEVMQEKPGENGKVVLYSRGIVEEGTVVDTEAMQAATDFVMDMAKQNEAVGIKTHVLTSEQAVAELAKMEREGNDVRFMGSRVPKRRKTIQKEIGGGNYSPITSEIVRAYIDEDYEPTINFYGADGRERVIAFIQGGEQGSGIKHSIYRHYGVRNSYFDSNDILKIEEVLKNGLRSVDGNKVEYRHEIDGVKHIVATRSKGANSKEDFVNFYTDKIIPLSQQGSHYTLPLEQAKEESGANIEQTNSKLEGNDVKNDKTEVLKTYDGTVYGWTKDGEIYLTPAGVNPNTPVHEYAGHVWGPAVRKNNPELWNQIKELAKQTKLWKEVMNDSEYDDIKGDEDLVTEEVLGRGAGRENAKRLNEKMNEWIAEEPDYLKKAQKASIWHRLKAAIAKAWKWVGTHVFDMKSFDDWQDVLDRSIYDFMHGTDLRGPEGDGPGGGKSPYMEAVESGNTQQASAMVQQAANKAMPDTVLRDAAGNVMPMYHGTNRYGFREFNDNAFFTPAKAYADNYTQGGHDDASKKGVYKVFLNITKPFDIRDKKAYEIFTEYRAGNKPAKTESGALDWAEFDYYDREFEEGLQQYLNDNYPGEYDGFVFDEGAVPGKDSEVVSRGLSYVPFEKNQIKSADAVTYDEAGNVIPLEKRFDIKKNDVYFSRTGDITDDMAERARLDDERRGIGDNPKRRQGESKASFLKRQAEWNEAQERLDRAEEALDPEPEMPAPTSDEDYLSEAYSERQRQWEQLHAEWEQRQREREQASVEKQIQERGYGADENGNMPSEPDEKQLREMMDDAKIDVTTKAMRSMIRNEIRERRRTIETGNWRDAVMVHTIKQKTTPEQRKALPFILEGINLEEPNETVKELLSEVEGLDEREKKAVFNMLNDNNGLNAVLMSDSVNKYLDKLEAALEGTEGIDKFRSDRAAGKVIPEHYREYVESGSATDKLIDKYGSRPIISSPDLVDENVGVVTVGAAGMFNKIMNMNTTVHDRRSLAREMFPDNGGVELTSELKSVAKEIRNWFDGVYNELEQAGLFNGKGNHKLDNYVTHIWDKKKSDPKVLKEIENRIRTSSQYTKHRIIASLREGLDAGLVMKYDDITDIMADYGHIATEAIANNALVRFIKDFEIDGKPILIDESVKDYDYKRIDNNALDGYKVYKPVVGTLNVVFANTDTSKFWRIYDLSAATMKKINLSASFFHHVALSESAISTMGPVRAMKVLARNIIWDAAIKGHTPGFNDTEVTADAVKHFVQLGSTKDYASKDVQRLTGKLKEWLYEKNVQGVKQASAALDWLNRGMDTVLWDYIHDGFKLYAYKHMADEVRTTAEKNGYNNAIVERQLDEVGQLVNDLFGGQYFDLLNISPSTERAFRRLLMSPDWNISSVRQVLAPFGLGQLYDKEDYWLEGMTEEEKKMAGDAKKKVDAMRKKFGVKFWVTAAMFFGLAMNGLNAMFRRWDEDQQNELAKERRKSDPAYKSPYELAYPNGMKWYDYTMYGNTVGNRTRLFIGRYDGGEERYARWGKQFREVPELFFGKDGFSIPGAALEKIAGKANPVLNIMSVLFSGSSISGYENEYMKGKEGLERDLGRLMALAHAAFPYSASAEDFFDFFMPSGKGYSPYKAKKAFSTAIIDGDEDMVAQVYKACVMNGLNGEELLKAAESSVASELRKEMMEGVKDLSDAVKQYDSENDNARKKQLEKYIKKQTARENYRAITVDDLLQQRNDAATLDNENVKAYDALKTSDDLMQDIRISSIRAGLKKDYDAWKDSGGEPNARAKAYRVINEYNKPINALKKRLGGKDDAKIMTQIRMVKAKMFEEIDKVK